LFVKVRGENKLAIILVGGKKKEGTSILGAGVALFGGSRKIVQGKKVGGKSMVTVACGAGEEKEDIVRGKKNCSDSVQKTPGGILTLARY